MAPKLYGTVLSPCVRAVLTAAKYIDVELEYIEVDLVKGEHLSPEFLKLNPKHTLPTLDDDGVVIWDSHAIMIYLIEKYASDKSLYPEDATKRATINRLLFFESGDIFSLHLRICLPMFYGETKEIPQVLHKAVIQGIDFLEIFLQNSKYVAGDEVTIADLSLWTTLSNVQGYVTLDEKKHHNILKWYKLMDSLPHAEININGSKLFREAIRKLL